MKDYLERLPGEIKDLIALAGEIAAKDNTPAYLVGGLVRDLILGVRNLDLDIVVEGKGIKFAEDLARSLKAKLIQHKRFGTATIMVHPRLKIDIASARKESYPQPASLPDVTPGTLKDDLSRRDFTINAMAISIMPGDFGKLIDFFHGKEDLHYKRVRILHVLSFIDDPTRILRAIRFEKRYNFKIETGTLKNLKQAVKLKMLEKVQPQRLRDELILVLSEKDPIIEVKRIQNLCGLGFISPRLSVSEAGYRFLLSIQRQIRWFERAYPKRRPLDKWLIYLIGMINTLKANEISEICKRFAFRRGEEKRMLSFKKIDRKFIFTLAKHKIKSSQIFRLLEPLSYEVIILIKAKNNSASIQRHIEDFFEVYNGMRLYISGDDLHGLGVKPGPYYQKIFARVLDAKVNGSIKTREEELALIKRLARV